MTYGNQMQCGCCGPGGDGPPFCPPTVRVLDCGGTPVAGAVVTVTIFGFPPIVGVTDGSGEYAFPDPFAPVVYGGAYFDGHYSIAWDGVTAGPFFGMGYNLYNCTHTVDYCYDHAQIAVSTTAAAVPEIAPGEGSPFAVTSGSGTGTIVLSYKTIARCSTPSIFPRAVHLVVVPRDPDAKYLSNCTTVTVHCDDSAAVSLPLFSWDADYAIHDLGCDPGCDDRGAGPNYRGLTPKLLFVTMDPAPYCSQYLGNLGGVPIPVTWNGAYWDSGCLPDPGIPCTASPYGPYYGSARVTITPGAFGFRVTFAAYGNADCTAPGAGGCAQVQVITATATCLSSPVDATLPASGSPPFCGFYFHVTE